MITTSVSMTPEPGMASLKTLATSDKLRFEKGRGL
jgi:hypothetical protein